jgi:hypothetical protein
MEISYFIREKQISNYETFKNILESPPFNLKVKEDVDYPNLFLICNQNEIIPPSESEMQQFLPHNIMNIIRECNGLIMEKNTFKIICYTFNKCLEDYSLDESLDTDNLYVEPALEGTLMRLYYYENKWNISTKKCIDAHKSKWLSEKSFYDLFIECLNNYNIEENLSITNCYSFILTHPENSIVVKYNNPQLYHVSTRNLLNLEEIDQNIGITKLNRQNVEKDYLPILIGQLLNDTNLSYEGYILIDTKYNRQKLKTHAYKKARDLWGNTNNRFMRFLELRKDLNMLNEYLTYYPCDKNNFINYENKISYLANDILQYYIMKHINKENIKIPFYFSKIIYKLHGDFFKNKVKTDYNKIILTLLELDPKKICFICNHHDKSKLQSIQNYTNITLMQG